MGTTDVILYRLDVARVGKELVARGTDLVGVGLMGMLQQFASQLRSSLERARLSI